MQINSTFQYENSAIHSNTVQLFLRNSLWSKSTLKHKYSKKFFWWEIDLLYCYFFEIKVRDLAIKWWFGKIFLSWFEFIYDNNPLPAHHLRINKINDNSKRFILLYPIFRWINKIKLKYFVVKFSILLQNHLQYKNNKSYLQVKHISISW